MKLILLKEGLIPLQRRITPSVQILTVLNALWVVQILLGQLLDFFSIFDLLPDDLIEMFGIVFYQLLICFEYDFSADWLLYLYLTLDHEETIGALWAIAEYGFTLVVAVEVQTLIAFLDGLRVCLISELGEEGIPLEE